MHYVNQHLTKEESSSLAHFFSASVSMGTREFVSVEKVWCVNLEIKQ